MDNPWIANNLGSNLGLIHIWVSELSIIPHRGLQILILFGAKSSYNTDRMNKQASFYIHTLDNAYLFNS